jgi:branched-chain amino acid transport system substrate-binding protein
MQSSGRRAFLRLVLGTIGSSGLLAACAPTASAPTPAPGKPADAPKPAAQATDAPKPAVQPTAVQKAPAAAGTASGPIKIGLLSAFSGPFAAFGPTQKDAMEIAFAEVNNTLGGRPVQLIVEDEGTEVQQALQKVRKLVEQDQVDVLVGIIQTPFAYGARDYIHENKVVFVCANAGGNALTRERKSPYIFRSSFSAWQNSFPLGEWTYKNVGKRVMVMATDFAFGHESADAFMDNFRKQGGTVLKEIYPRLGTTDFGPFLPDVQSTRPEFAYVFFAGADAVAFIKQWDEFGVGKDVPLTGTGDVVEEIVLPAQGRGGLGARTSLHWAWGLETPENAAYKDAFKKKTNREADQYGVQAYDAAKALTLAVNQTQGDVSDKDKLIKALEGVAFNSPRGPFRFDVSTHQVVYNVYIREVRDFSGTLHNAVIDTFKDVQDPGA